MSKEETDIRKGYHHGFLAALSFIKKEANTVITEIDKAIKDVENFDAPVPDMNDKITKETAAKILNGRKYGKAISNEEAQLLKRSGLVAVSCYNDDSFAEFHGAIRDIAGTAVDEEVYINTDGVLKNFCDDVDCLNFEEQTKRALEIKVIWNVGDYTWSYDTVIPHATFDIMYHCEKYCRGIIFDMADVRRLLNTKGE